ncbi:MAG: CARDB domain-containing protein [Bacteroidota bacterium]
MKLIPSLFLIFFSLFASVISFGQTGEGCANAIDLSALISPIDGTTVGFADDFTNSCLVGSNDRIFFIDVPDGNTIIIGQQTNNYDSRNRVAYGGACPGQVEVECWDDPDSYYVFWLNTTGVSQRVWWIQEGYSSSSAGNFTLEWLLLPPPVNDECANATPFPAIPTDNSCAYVNAHTVSATESLAGCVGSADDDIWFSFVAPATSISTELNLISGSGDMVHEVFSGSCGTLNSILCSDPESNTLTGLTTGETYFIRVYSYASSGYSEFELCLKVPPQPPANDLCSDAIPISCGQTISGSTLNSTVDPIGCAFLNSTSGYGVWYTVQGNGNEITVNLCDADYDNQVAVFTGDCSSLNCFAGDDDWCCTFCGGQVTFQSTAGETYYIWVVGYQSGIGNFSIAVDCDVTLVSDLLPVSLLSPVNNCEISQPQEVQIEISNGGVVPQSNFTVGYTFENTTETETFFGTIQPGSTATFTFSETVDMSNIGSFDFQLFTDLLGDQNPFNDTLTVSVEHLPPLEVDAYFWFGNDSICQSETVFIATDYNPDYQYQWSTGDIYYLISDVPDSNTTYSVTVTDTAHPGCTAVASIAATVFEAPAVPVPFPSSNTLCPGGTVTISVFNVSGNLIWNTGETGPTITVSQPGYYCVTHVGENGCTSKSDWIYIGQESEPDIWCFGDCVICGQETQNLQVNFGESFQWSTGETTQVINVMPAVTTTYSVTVTTQNNCIHVREETVTVASDAPPGTPTNLLPPDGSQNVALPLQLTWAPAANATHYDVYIWPENEPEPTAFPYYTTSQINLTVYGGLQYGETYRWKVCARNACSSAAENCSISQKFTLNFLPDLIVVADSINAPDTVFSGTEFVVSWLVENSGIGSTQGISSSAFWHDACYLSTDAVLSFDDRYLGARLNPTALLSGFGYNNSLTATLPEGIQGEFYLIVCTDRYNYLPESDEQNNHGIRAIPMTILLSPYPDLTVNSLTIDGAAGGVVFPGEGYDLNWRVVNQSHGLNSAPTKANWWYDRIYLSRDSFFNPQTAFLQKTLRHDGNLDQEATYDSSWVITIPPTAEGTWYAFVCTDATDREYEFVFEDNNCFRSIPLLVNSPGKPDFLLTGTQAPDTVSNRESITVNWTGQNIGADFDGHLSDRVYINDQPNLTGAQWLGSASQNFGSSPLLNLDTYSNEAQLDVPSNITGKYYLIVVTNGGNGVSESDFTNNLLVDSICVLTPNLTVTNVVSPPEAISGQTIIINWTVANIGPGDLLGTYVSDRVQLLDVIDPGNSFYLPPTAGGLTIFAGDSASRQRSYTIPNGLTGSFCLEVTTNYTQGVYENGLYNDNTFITCDTFNILPATYSDLVASSIASQLDSATAGNVISIGFSVKNAGEAATLGSWNDRVLLSRNNTWPLASPLFLGSSIESQVTPVDSSYERQLAATLPSYLDSGNYYLCLDVDAGDAVFENEESNNRICSTQPIYLNVYPRINLTFVGLPIGPDVITPGVPATVSYSVENEGNAITPANLWYDGLYLSPNPSWQPTDVLLAEWQRNGALEAGGTYQAQENFTLPPNFNGAFYLHLVIDHQNAVIEDSETDNIRKILQSNGNDSVIVSYPEKPDLSVDSLTVPTNGTAGQPLSITYKIKNTDPDGEALGNWTEAAYLSSDSILSAGDVFLGQKANAVQLSSLGSYPEEMEITLPLGLSGNYFLLVKTDAGNVVSEEDENNNVRASYIFLTQPAPGDLIVKKDAIEAPPIDTIATEITISWYTANIGQNPLSGFMQEGVYLSEDENWDASDLLLGTWSGTIGLDPGSAVQHEITARLENVRRQDYHVFVKTDLLDHFLEEEETNNCSNGPATVFVEVPELPIGLPATDAHLALEQPIYYRIEIPTDTIGETMRVSIASSDSMAFNELYLRRNNIPSRTQHDFSFPVPFTANQEITVPALASGTYYVMAYAVEGTPVQDVGLLAEIIPFQITSINVNQGSNTGFVTALLEGAKFHPGMSVWLTDPDLGDIIAVDIQVINSSRAFVTFPLEGASLGLYDVVAQDSSMAVADLPDGFSVIGGTAGNAPLLADCSIDLGNQTLTLTNVSGLVDILQFEPVHPSVVRPNQVVPITLKFTNISNVDVPAPSRIFSSLDGFPLSTDTDELTEDLQELSLLFTEENGPANVLRPGGVAFVTVYSKATQSEGVMKFKLLSN